MRYGGTTAASPRTRSRPTFIASGRRSNGGRPRPSSSLPRAAGTGWRRDFRFGPGVLLSLERDIELLAQVPLFSDLDGDQLRLIAFSSARRELDAGQILFMKGDAATSAFIVSHGAIELQGDRNIGGGT